MKAPFPQTAMRKSFAGPEMECRAAASIQDAYRTPEAQLLAFNSGHSELEYGYHNCTGSDGKKEGLAVDLRDDDYPLNARKSYLPQLAHITAKHGLTSGIRWGLAEPLQQAIEAAIRDKAWKALVMIGWDPTHVEPTGITLEQAKARKRPEQVFLEQ